MGPNTTAAELLIELQHAHQIILNALSIMTTEQKSAWARQNERDGCDGEGTTRYHERVSAISRAAGADVCTGATKSARV